MRKPIKLTTRTRPSGLTRIECTAGESEGWVWSFATFSIAWTALVLMATDERTAPDGWFAADAPDGRRVRPPAPLVEDLPPAYVEGQEASP